MTTTLPLFWHLSSASKKERIDASVKLVGALEQFQSKFVPKESLAASGSEEEDDEEAIQKSDGLDALNAQDVSYSIRRLVRGLASPRESSRLGFAVALTELLSRIDTVSCSQITTLIMDTTKSQGSMTGQEERDVLFARLFGLTAVIQSGLLVRDGALPTSGSSAVQSSTLESYRDTVTQLVVLGEKKSWLRESAWWTIILAIDALKESNVAWKDDAVEATLDILFVENKIWSPEKVALALKLQSLYPKHDWQQLFSPSFKNPDLFSPGNLQNVARILKESTTNEDDSKDIPKAAAGSWKPALHFVWDIILDQLLPGPNSQTFSKGSFQEFFRIVVDESLFSSTSSPERKYWGFQVFQKALPRVDQANMPMLFTKNFMRSWINHLSHKDRYLHKIAMQAATEVQAFVQKNPQLGFALILQLTGANGSRQFDRLTKTKTVETILTSMDIDGIKSYIDYLLEQVDDSTTGDKGDIQATNTRRSWIIDQLVALIHNGSIPKSDEWIQSILDWLVINGLFILKKKSEKSSFRGLHTVHVPAFSEQLRQNCRNRLLSCLSDLSSQTTVIKSVDKSIKASAVASDGEFWVSKVLVTIEQLEKDTKHVSFWTDIEEEDRALLVQAKELAARIKSTPDQQEAAKGAELLLLATVLQQYCTGEEGTIDSESLEACIDGSTRMFPEKPKTKKSRKSTGEPTNAVPEPVDVLVDTIIGCLEKSTAYMRTIGNQVFSLLSGSVQESTVDLIVTQLERIDSVELMASDGDDTDDAEDEDEDDSEEDSVISEDHDSGDDDNEDVDVELRDKIEEALRVNGIEAATSDSDEEEEEELMDDDQMMAIDEQLADIFRSRASEKKSSKGIDAQREATHFKNRILDLVDTFVKKQPGSPHVIRFIPPLIELILDTASDERQLSDKAKGILKSRIGKSKEVPSGVSLEQLTVVINDIHTRARKVHSSDLLATLSQCSVYLSKIMLHLKAEESLVDIYRQSLADFLTRKNSALNASFFHDFIRRYSTTAWHLRADLIELSEGAVNAYRQCQAFQLIEVLVGQLPNMGDRQTEVLEFMTILRKALLAVTANACDDKVILTTAQLKELLKLGLLAIRQTHRVAATSPSINEIWQPEAWDGLCKKLQASLRFKSSPALQKMCEQIVRTSTPQANNAPSKPSRKSKVPAVAKRKATEVSGDEQAATEIKKIKRKKVKKDKS